MFAGKIKIFLEKFRHGFLSRRSNFKRAFCFGDLAILQLLLLLLLLLLLPACNDTAKREQIQVSFSQDIQPILADNCLECHSNNGSHEANKGLSMESYESLMQGTMFAPVVVAGDPFSSSLYRLITSNADPRIRMPHGKAKLIETDVATIELWIEQGAKQN